MKISLFWLVIGLFVFSCSSKKQILYFQDSENFTESKMNYENPTIQPNDILKISVETLVPEAAIPYNKTTSLGATASNIEIVQLDGYLVSNNKSIIYPVLGEVSVDGLTTSQVEEELKKRLEDGHLINPTVNVRLLNAKFTVMGEVKKPGTYTFSEQSITILQALGYAGDLTINGERNDILVIREIDGERRISHLNLTSSKLFESSFYNVKPNDVIVVNPNSSKVKSAGFVGNAGTVLTIASLVLSTVILLTR